MRQARHDTAAREGEAKPAAGGGENRAQLYDEVTAKIIAQLEAGRFPWVQPWGKPQGGGAGLAPGLPHNALTGRAYSGVNVLLLWGSVIEFAYPSQGWLTFKQALEAGGNVRKGEKGVSVVYADRFTLRPKRSARSRAAGMRAAFPF